ncbi:MAG TPA: excinuclease ABC subunit A [Phaeodactylibacter sp.]|nr:excinuclease ABC subunit A [Phaeodactylibacter sp.]
MAKNSTSLFLEKRDKKALKEHIEIKGARANNLKDIHLQIPKNKLIVVTGVSGSGKSSITMDTLYAEGQRRYVESLSSYARQFLMRMKKPDVDYINGICPAIAIEQKVSTRNARSTVGTLTEIYDYLRLLYARIGKTYSPISGKEVKRHQVSDVVDFIQSQKEGSKIQLFIPLQQKYERSVAQEFKLLVQKGYTRVWYKKELQDIQDLLDAEDKVLSKKVQKLKKEELLLLIDRLVVRKDDIENIQRSADSVQTAFNESEGTCIVDIIDGKRVTFNNRFELDGMTFLEPSHQLFNYNNPYGACPKCEGYGQVLGIDEQKVIPDPSKSIYEGAIACWRGGKSMAYLQGLLKNAHHFGFPLHRPYQELTKEQRRLLWTGNRYFRGIDDYFATVSAKIYKIQNRVLLSRYRGRTTCHLCDGGRLRKEASYVKVQKKSIMDLVLMPVDELLDFFKKLKLSKYDASIADRIILEINTRLSFMVKMGLGYLTLNRVSSTLSGGETQRINLTRTLGSNLTSSMYILDEPSIGLHPKDSSRLVEVLKSLRDAGNTVIVVEHEEDIIKNADYLIDMGPEAGIHGGEVVYAGPFKDIFKKASQSLTTLYMTGQKEIPVPKRRRKFSRSIYIKGATQHNLKNIDVQFPLNTLIVVSGVSGSGKTTLVKQILYPAMLKYLGEPYKTAPGTHSELAGNLKRITQLEMVNQSPIGKSSRSNPVTYVKAYDAIRKLMAEQQLARIYGFKASHFSFNVEGGRCEECRGEGEQIVEMQFLADVRLECEACKGRRFRAEVLEIAYKGKNIFEILDLSVEEALDFFQDQKDIIQKIQPLYDVGLGYVKLGQSSSTLSGGEAQRVKLASFLAKQNSKEHILFIFDEPTTGLHFHDIQKLLDALNALVEKGHTVIVVEHNMEIIKSADWLIDLGPGGGKHGGKLVFQGIPEDILQVKESHTGQFLKEKL